MEGKMKIYRSKLASLMLSGVALIAITGCWGDSNSSGGGTTEYVAVFPTSMDNYEANADNNASTTTTTIEVGGELQTHSIYPHGDYDWIKVELEEGKLYNFFTTNLNEVGDTYLYLYDNVDQSPGNHVDSDDDYIDYDSHIEEFNATYTGTYYLKVRSYDYDEVTSYQIGVVEHMDADEDGYIPYFDCNDMNDSIYVEADEIIGDGIDQDCNGEDLPTVVADNYEVDNVTPKSMAETQGSYEEYQHRNDIYSKKHSLHEETDVDLFAVTIPAKSKSEIIISDYFSDFNQFDWTVYDSNDTVVDDGSDGIWDEYTNDTNHSIDYVVEIAGYGGGGTGWYVPAFVDHGEDRDNDGYYTMDWSADCDDTNSSRYPGATDNYGDGIDQNCDGFDGEFDYQQ